MFTYEELVWLFIDFLIPMSSECLGGGGGGVNLRPLERNQGKKILVEIGLQLRTLLG